MIRLAIIALLAAGLAPPASATASARLRPGSGEVSVACAVSLSEVMGDVAKLFALRSGERLVLNTGASNTLARQIEAGARVDVFISADEAQMDAVAAHIVAGSRRDLLSNQLAIAVPDDRPRSVASPRALLDPAIRRIAIGDPVAVPAGVYAKAYLETLGLWDALASKMVPSGSVRLALAAVENGAADAAIVYRTDLRTARRTREAFVVPAGDGPRIVYPVAAITGGGNPEGAGRLLEFLDSPEARALFKRAGFTPVAPARTLK